MLRTSTKKQNRFSEGIVPENRKIAICEVSNMFGINLNQFRAF
jgi:hypothetical protein